ncbi:MAG: hypothetical protein WDZ76_14945 [Pseudohongiellaceae bacterium]
MDTCLICTTYLPAEFEAISGTLQKSCERCAAIHVYQRIPAEGQPPFIWRAELAEVRIAGELKSSNTLCWWGMDTGFGEDAVRVLLTLGSAFLDFYAEWQEQQNIAMFTKELFVATGGGSLKTVVYFPPAARDFALTRQHVYYCKPPSTQNLKAMFGDPGALGDLIYSNGGNAA